MSNDFFHIFVCVNKKPDDSLSKSCGRASSEELFLKLKRKAAENKIRNIKLTKTFCLGKCSQGPAAVIYPEGKYIHVTESNLNKVIAYLENKNDIADLLI